MCGIAGFSGFEDKKLIKKFSRELAHRGPDGEGIYVDRDVTLLNRRLAIIDLKTGDQPIYNEDKSIVTVYNGEIYNYKELRKVLEEKGHKFKTLSDTEVIVHGYEEWGDRCFDKFNGMFAVALYNRDEERLVLARDHFGIKPLYFSWLPGGKLLFSSEIKPLIQSGLIDKKVNEKVLYRYLRFRVHDDGPETFFQEVYRVMPGQLLIVEGKKLRNMYFSHLEDDLKSALATSEKVTLHDIDTFKAQLTEAIKLRLISDVPVGTCLSGGLDSSTVVATVNNLLEQNVFEAKSVGKVQHTFSAVFPNSSNDEERYIDALISNKLKVKSHKIRPTTEEFFHKDLEDFVRTQEEPTISTGPYAQYKVMQEAKDHVKVLLDGQGADELMAGYLPYYFVYLRQLRSQGKYDKLLKELFYSFDIVAKYVRLKFTSSFDASRMLARPFVKRHKEERFTTINNNLKLRLVEDIFYNSLPSLLRYEDRNSMRFSIEGRVPFLDFNLIKYIFSLPDEAIIEKGWNKSILRKAVQGLLPEEIVKRRNKIGFTTPEEEWFMRMKNTIYSIFLSESFTSRPYFNQQEVIKGFHRFIEGKTQDTLSFWRVLNTEIWLRIFFDSPDKTEQVLKKKEIKKFVQVDDQQYVRHLIKTDVFQNGDDIVKKVTDYVAGAKLPLSHVKKWYVVVSEKVVAISQGRSFFIWDIHPGFWAQKLQKFVRRTPYGIGLGSPWTMQLAIDEVGLPKILLASLVAAVTKPLGIKGMFYRIAGSAARSIDGPTEYSLYPSNVSAKLAPRNPQKVCESIKSYLLDNLKLSDERSFGGVAIIDANDLGQNILGNATDLTDQTLEKIFSDNPMGQGSEQTPITIVAER